MAGSDGTDLLACPACGGSIEEREGGFALLCAQCARRWPVAAGVADFVSEEDPDPAKAAVARFYERFPFPGYERYDSPAALVEKARRGRFAAELDRAIAPGARILDLGCGTGQLSVFLALGRRVVVGADLSRASLERGAKFAARFDIAGVRFVRTDLLRPALATRAFDVVVSTGVLHHLPDPRAGFATAASLVRPGGYLVVGLYHRLGRLPTRIRGAVIRLFPERLAFLDPRVRAEGWTGERRTAWIRDQYAHPLEHRHRVGEVLRWFREEGLDYVSSAPAISASAAGSLFSAGDPGRRLGRALREWSWPFRLGREGGLFLTVGRRPAGR